MTRARGAAVRRAAGFAPLLCVFAAACAAPLMRLPAGPGAPAPDAVGILTQATAACRGIQTMTAEIGASGSAAGRRVRGRLLAGLAAPASVRLEALAPFGPPVFIFTANDDDATLLLPRDERVLEHGRPGAVLDAAAGVPLDAAELWATMTGCAPMLAQPEGRSLGEAWRLVSGPAPPPGPGAATYRLYLHRDEPGGPWRLVASTRDSAAGGAWRAEYRDFENGLPHSIRVTGEGAAREAFDLRLTLSQVETNVALGADVFRVDIPPSAAPMTLEELRGARPGLRED